MKIKNNTNIQNTVHKGLTDPNTDYSVPLNEFKKVFLDFDEYGVGYCVLRNFEFLSDASFSWEGLDMTVCKDDFGKVHQILLRHGFIERKQQFSRRHRAYFKLVDGVKVSFDIQVGGVYWNDMKYLGESIIANRMRKEFFYVPGANDFFLMLLVHSILGKRYFKQKYQEMMCSLLEQDLVDEDVVIHHLSLRFTRKMAKRILASVRLKQFRKIPVAALLCIFVCKNPK